MKSTEMRLEQAVHAASVQTDRLKKARAELDKAEEERNRLKDVTVKNLNVELRYARDKVKEWEAKAQRLEHLSPTWYQELGAKVGDYTGLTGLTTFFSNLILITLILFLFYGCS